MYRSMNPSVVVSSKKRTEWRFLSPLIPSVKFSSHADSDLGRLLHASRQPSDDPDISLIGSVSPR
jgi:hypothetical protein